MTTPEPPAAGGHDRYVVIGEYLVEDTGTCTCGVEDTGASAGAPGPYQHEQYCGLEPVARIADIVAWAATQPQQPTVNLTPTEYAFRSILGTLASLDPVARARVIRDVRARIGEVAEPETRHATPTPPGPTPAATLTSRNWATATIDTSDPHNPDDDWDPEEGHPR